MTHKQICQLGSRNQKKLHGDKLSAWGKMPINGIPKSEYFRNIKINGMNRSEYFKQMWKERKLKKAKEMLKLANKVVDK